jgi:hypothetical protein
LSILVSRNTNDEAFNPSSFSTNCPALPRGRLYSSPLIVILRSDSFSITGNSTLKSKRAPARIAARSIG